MKKNIIFICIIIACFIMCLTSAYASANEGSYEKIMRVSSLWKYSKGENQVIAFIDTGLTKDAYELYKERIVSPFNILNGNQNVEDTLGHGTQLVSIACGDGQIGIVGIAPKAKILPIKAIRENGNIDAKTIAKAISYATKENATIINLSFGSHVEDSDVKHAIDEALHKNITVIASAGDYGQKDLLFPASMQGVISIEATDENGKIWEMSNTSEKNESTFPGTNISMLTLHNAVTINNGTSYSCALASGYAAIMRAYLEQQRLDVNNQKITQKMKLINVTKTNNVDYLQPLEDLNIKSISNQFKFMLHNNFQWIIFAISVIAFVLISAIRKYRVPKIN